jgi:hypothetical protein
MHSADDSQKMNQPDPATESSRSDAPLLGGELQALEAAWAQLRPSTDGIDRDRLLFLAGQASVAPARRRQFLQWYWPLSSLGMSAVAAALLCALMLRDGSPTGERTVYDASKSVVGVANAKGANAEGGSAIGGSATTNAGPATAETIGSPAGRVPPSGWTVGMQWRLGDDFVLAEPTAANPNVPDYPAGAGETSGTLSTRSFSELLDPNGDPRGPSTRTSPARPSAPGAKS